MPDHAVDRGLADRLSVQLAQSGLLVVVEASDGALVISGVVETEEAHQAVLDIVATAAPDAQIDDSLEVQSILPPDIDRFVSDEPSTEPPRSRRALREQDEELDPDFTDQPLLRDPVAAAGPNDSEDPAESGDEVYTPPNDPVITTDRHGRAHVLGGFDAEDSVPVERSAMDDVAGDEALADAIREELREDASTADLMIVVAVRNGVAHLRGRVPGLEDAENAEAVAARVVGVREVVEELEVASV
jgi:osmotically-inducible protein OsmY